MTTPDTSVDDTAALDYDAAALDYDAAADEDWFAEEDELPRRPRRRLLGPVPATLLAILLLAGGFLAGVLVEKGQTSSASPAAGGSAAGLAARFRALRAGTGEAGGKGTGNAGAAATGGAPSAGSGGEAGAARGIPGAGATAGATAGQVAFVEGDTLYVTDAEGNTVKVHTSKASQVTKTVKSDVKGIHPGETVLITGPTAKDGTVSAESIRVGTGLGGGLGALLGRGASSGGAGAGGSGESSSPDGSGPSLFGNG